MRDLQKSDRNEMLLNDTISGSEILIYYRTPTTKEQVRYQQHLVKKKGKKVMINAFQTRLEHGLNIITGFKKGDFGINGKPISSDPKDPEFHKDWKRLLQETAADIVTTVAFAVFEGARIDTGTELDYSDDDDEKEEASEEVPLESSSAG